MRGRRVGGALALGFMLAVLAGSASEAFQPRISHEQLGKAAALLINGRQAVVFRAANGKLAPLERAQITHERMSALVAAKLDPKAVYAAGDAHNAKVCAGDQVICRVTPYDAKLRRTTAIALAQSWVGQIRELLAMPPIVVEPAEVTVPLGEDRTVRIGGAAVGPVYVKADDESIIGLAAKAEDKSLTVTGKHLGKALVEISVQGERATLAVYVKKYAGRVPGVSIGEVTGNPCPSSLVCYAARQAVAQSIVLEPNASVEMGAVKNPNQALPPGRSRELKVDVRITGSDYLPYTAKAVAVVKNVVMAREVPDQLFYSNNPESVTRYQTLFAGRLDPDRVTRLLYHHQNMMGKRVHLIVELLNPNNDVAKIRVHRGISSPSKDTIAVGLVAGSAFLRDTASDISVVEAIPPQSRLVLISDMLGNKDTASGIMELKHMDGQPAYVRITAAPPFVDDVSVGTIAQASDAALLQMSPDIYAFPVKTIDEEYAVGSRWVFVPLGKHALTDDKQQMKLYGNYGVTYNINVNISNPTADTRKVVVLFDPTAGPASGAFYVDGKFVKVQFAQPPDEIVLSSIVLAPGEARKCRITTVPLAGSNYPATVIVRS